MDETEHLKAGQWWAQMNKQGSHCRMETGVRNIVERWKRGFWSKIVKNLRSGRRCDRGFQHVLMTILLSNLLWGLLKDVCKVLSTI
jgi:hypothetical protein